MSLKKLPEIKAFDQLAELPTEQFDDEIEGYDETLIAADNADINIYGVIGRNPNGDDNSERRISAALRSIGDREITVNINSPGGSFYSGLAIYNLLRQHPDKVTVKVLGSAGSAASVIAMAGDEILIAEGANIMVHAASALVMGNRFDMEELNELLAQTDAEMAKLYAAQSGVEVSVAAEWMDRNRGRGKHFYAEEAIKVGLATGRLPTNAVRAEDRKTMPPERRAERALMRGQKLSAADAKALIGEIKTGARDATDMTARDAGETAGAMHRLLETMTARSAS